MPEAPIVYYGEMDGILTLVAVLSLAIYIGLIVAATVIASRKGRSAIGWCFLTIIFPIAILFVAIAAPANAYVQQRKQVSEPNAIDSQIIQSVRRNPIVFGFLGLIPSFATALEKAILHGFWLPWYDTCILVLIYYFLLFWLVGIGIAYKQKKYWIAAIFIYFLNKLVPFILSGAEGSAIGWLSWFVLPFRDYFFFIHFLMFFDVYHFFYRILVSAAPAIILYFLQNQLNKRQVASQGKV